MASLYVVFHADWVEPPGEVIASFWSEDDAKGLIGEGDNWGRGWLIVQVLVPPRLGPVD